MSVKRRLDAIEDKIANNDDGCLMFIHYWDPDTNEALQNPICPKGHELSRDMHECGTCTVPAKNRTHIHTVMVDMVEGKAMLMGPGKEPVRPYDVSRDAET